MPTARSKVAQPTLGQFLGLGDESPSLPHGVSWFPSFSSHSARTRLALPGAGFHHARGTGNCSRSHQQPQGRARDGQGLLGSAPCQTRVPQPKQRGCSEGRSAGLGQKSRVARGTSSHSQGHPARSSPWRHGSVQAVMTSPAYPSPWLPCATGALPALALSLVPVLALEAYVSPGLLHCPRSCPLPGHGTGRCVAGSALWPWLRTPFPGQAPERGAGTDTDCRYSRARPVSCDMSYLMAVPQEPEIP